MLQSCELNCYIDGVWVHLTWMWTSKVRCLPLPCQHPSQPCRGWPSLLLDTIQDGVNCLQEIPAGGRSNLMCKVRERNTQRHVPFVPFVVCLQEGSQPNMPCLLRQPGIFYRLFHQLYPFISIMTVWLLLLFVCFICFSLFV